MVESFFYFFYSPLATPDRKYFFDTEVNATFGTTQQQQSSFCFFIFLPYCNIGLIFVGNHCVCRFDTHKLHFRCVSRTFWQSAICHIQTVSNFHFSLFYFFFFVFLCFCVHFVLCLFVYMPSISNRFTEFDFNKAVFGLG